MFICHTVLENSISNPSQMFLGNFDAKNTIFY